MVGEGIEKVTCSICAGSLLQCCAQTADTLTKCKAPKSSASQQSCRCIAAPDVISDVVRAADSAAAAAVPEANGNRAGGQMTLGDARARRVNSATRSMTMEEATRGLG